MSIVNEVIAHTAEIPYRNLSREEMLRLQCWYLARGILGDSAHGANQWGGIYKPQFHPLVGEQCLTAIVRNVFKDKAPFTTEASVDRVQLELSMAQQKGYGDLALPQLEHVRAFTFAQWSLILKGVVDA